MYLTAYLAMLLLFAPACCFDSASRDALLMLVYAVHHQFVEDPDSDTTVALLDDMATALCLEGIPIRSDSSQ